jgi:parallel beta-helix repeat protein
VTKSLTIRSENGPANCVVHASEQKDHVFTVTADWVDISGFTVQDATEQAGIHLANVDHCTISENTASNNRYGIYLLSSSTNTLTGNWVHHNTERGFHLTGGSTGNTIENNNIMANGVLKEDGSYQWQFYNAQTVAVEVKNNYWGVDSSKIDASIYDNEECEGTGEVTFYPPQTGPCEPVPELPTGKLLSTGLLALAGYVGLRRKSNN